MRYVQTQHLDAATMSPATDNDLPPTPTAPSADEARGPSIFTLPLADLRAGGDAIGGPAPFAKTDRSRFLQALDEALVRLARL